MATSAPQSTHDATADALAEAYAYLIALADEEDTVPKDDSEEKEK
jgi:hypothetical protein